MPDGMDQSAPYETMGASLLSEQPPSLPDKPTKNDPDWDLTFTHLESNLGSLRNWRYSWWAYWSQLASYFIPRRYKFLVTAGTMNRGSPINDQIIDSTGTLAMNVCASGLWTGLTNPARPWFKMSVGIENVDLDEAAKEWLEDTEKRIYAVLHQSNFYSIMAQAFQDITVFGTAPVIIYEDDEDTARCYLPCAGEYYLAVGARLSVDTLYREYTSTVKQIVDQFRLENCPPQVQKLWEQGRASLQNEFVVAHAIEPNYALTRRGKQKGSKYDVVPRRFVYREVYWLKGMKTPKPLSKRGFMSAPFMAARWFTTANDAYGRSPCMDALGDTKQIQQETRRKAEFIEKGVRPPMGADPELKNEPASIIPAQITYMNTAGGKKGFWPLFEVRPDWLPALMQDIESVKSRIRECLFVDVFMAITKMAGIQPRNELEITERNLERLQILGPFVDRFETEFAAPAIRRFYDIMNRKRMIKPMPPSLRNVPLKLNFVSIMRLAQRAAETITMKDVFATAGGLSSAAKAAGVPDPIRVLDLDNAMRHYADLAGYPISCVFSPDEVAAHDQAREQGKAQAQALPATMAGVSAAKTLSETDTAGPSLLNNLLTGNPRGQ